MSRKYSFYKWLIPGALLAALTLDACKHESVGPVTTTSGTTTGGANCDPNTVYFQTQVLPILVSNCAKSGCHDAATAADGNNFTTYEGVMDSGEVEPGEPEDSDIIEVLFEDDDDKIMPPPGHPRPSNEQINLIRTWIAQGAQNNTCTETACDTLNVTFSNAVLPVFKQKCTGCHSTGFTSGGVNVSTHAGAAAIALDNNRLWRAVNHTGPHPMPQGGQKLPACDLAKIRIWIEAGAPNN